MLGAERARQTFWPEPTALDALTDDELEGLLAVTRFRRGNVTAICA
jgi:hypothetical protein